MKNDFKETLLFIALITAIICILILWFRPIPKQPSIIPPVFIHETDVSAHYRTNSLDLVYGYSMEGYHTIEVIRDNETGFTYEAETREQALSYMASLIAFERGIK